MATTESSPLGHQPADDRRLAERLRTLEERYRHELLSDNERQVLRARIIRLRRRLCASEERVR